MSDSVPPWDDLDPGIRRVVRLLHENGFDTCDSGDGKAKFGEDGKPLPGWQTDDQDFDCVNPFPHVAISVSGDKLAAECDRLRDVLKQHGVDVGVCSPDDADIFIQGTYDPASEHPAVIVLSGLGDERLG